MGDFLAPDLWQLYPQHRAATCWGCGGLIVPEHRGYANADHIWHTGCWPRTDRSLASYRSSSSTETEG